MKTLLNTLLLVISLTLLVDPVEAGDVTLTCTPPTQNEDGTALTDLAGYKFYQSTVQGGPYTEVHDEPDETNCGAVLTGLADGTYYYVATAYNVPGVESAYSGEASKTITTVPNPPGDLVANGNLVAYALSMTEDIFLTYPVGTIMAGTPCNVDMNANGMYLVPRASVTFAGGADAYVVFAECGTQ